MSDDELIELVLDRILNSEIFCQRMLNACIKFIQLLDEE